MTLIEPIASAPLDIDSLEQVQRRILWLAVRMVDYANHDRPASAGSVKVGGHQASSASMVSIMTSLWFGHLSGHDKVTALGDLQSSLNQAAQ